MRKNSHSKFVGFAEDLRSSSAAAHPSVIIVVTTSKVIDYVCCCVVVVDDHKHPSRPSSTTRATGPFLTEGQTFDRKMRGLFVSINRLGIFHLDDVSITRLAANA